jgi:hypothetical protein
MDCDFCTLLAQNGASTNAAPGDQILAACCHQRVIFSEFQKSVEFMDSGGHVRAHRVVIERLGHEW